MASEKTVGMSKPGKVVNLHKTPIDRLRELIDTDTFESADAVVIVVSTLDKNKQSRYTDVYYDSDDVAKIIYALTTATLSAVDM